MSAAIIIENASILTMDPAMPWATALAVKDGRILAVGDRAAVAGHRTAATRVVDAGGASVLPGFIDSHIHLFVGGVMLDNISLAGLRGVDAIRSAVARRAQERPGDRIIVAEHADYTMFGDDRPITRHILDRILPDRPLAFYCADHHTLWANTPALVAAGLLHGRELPDGNTVVMGDDGLATGVLLEFEAFRPVLELAPSGGREMLGLLAEEPDGVTPAARAVDRDILARALGHCASLGITTFHNMDGNSYQLELLSEIDAACGLPVRGRVPFRFMPGMSVADLAKAVELRRRFSTDRLKADFVKMFMDGVIEGTTAFLLDDYGTRPGHRGVAYFEQEEFDAICTEADRLGFQIAVHAVGDGAVRRTLNGYEAARRGNGPRDSRHRIEHIEMLDADDVPRFRELGVVCSMQPAHAPSRERGVEPLLDHVGRERLRHGWAWQTLRRTGARLAFSSDWPVAPLAPVAGLAAAMMRAPLFPGFADERQSLIDAIGSFTVDGAYCGFEEDRKGVLKEGAAADVVVLADDVEKLPPEAIAGTAVRMTLCGGRITHEA